MARVVGRRVGVGTRQKTLADEKGVAMKGRGGKAVLHGFEV